MRTARVAEIQSRYT